MSAVITKLTFDDEASVPILQFEMKGFLNEKMGPKALDRADKREWEEFDVQQIAHDTSASGALPPPQTQQAAPPQQQAPVQQPAPVQQQAPVEEAPKQAEPESVEDLLQQW